MQELRVSIPTTIPNHSSLDFMVIESPIRTPSQQSRALRNPIVYPTFLNQFDFDIDFVKANNFEVLSKLQSRKRSFS
jgi:hypothetical protein